MFQNSPEYDNVNSISEYDVRDRVSDLGLSLV